MRPDRVCSFGSWTQAGVWTLRQAESAEIPASVRLQSRKAVMPYCHPSSGCGSGGRRSRRRGRPFSPVDNHEQRWGGTATCGWTTGPGKATSSPRARGKNLPMRNVRKAGRMAADGEKATESARARGPRKPPPVRRAASSSSSSSSSRRPECSTWQLGYYGLSCFVPIGRADDSTRCCWSHGGQRWWSWADSLTPIAICD